MVGKRVNLWVDYTKQRQRLNGIPNLNHWPQHHARHHFNVFSITSPSSLISYPRRPSKPLTWISPSAICLQFQPTLTISTGWPKPPWRLRGLFAVLADYHPEEKLIPSYCQVITHLIVSAHTSEEGIVSHCIHREATLMDVEQHQPSPCWDQCRPYTESNGRRLVLQSRDTDPPKMRPFMPTPGLVSAASLSFFEALGEISAEAFPIPSQFPLPSKKDSA